MTPPQIHDLIGVGFGPSNLALAIALDEARAAGGAPFEALFLERQPSFAWHPDMMLPGTHMQVSYLKDLATLRNPCSRFTFVNYLHGKSRLQDFINLKTFFPSRHEFNDYLAWAAAQFDDRTHYGEEVVEVLPDTPGPSVSLLRVRTRTRDGELRERLARNLVVGVGGRPHVPDNFRGLRGDPRVMHTHHYLGAIGAHASARRIAVIGAGQSATEVFLDLARRPGGPHVDLVMRARAIKPSDDSPFVNEIFNPDFTDVVFDRPPAERAALLDEFRHTNYAAPDHALLEQLYDLFYQQRVVGDERHRFLRRHEVRDARASDDGIALTLADLNGGRTTVERYDAVVLGTGYERDVHRGLLAPLAPYLGDMEVGRDYRVAASDGFRPGVYLQGACEQSHGLSDTLLSVTAIRTQEIGASLLAGRSVRSAPRSEAASIDS